MPWYLKSFFDVNIANQALHTCRLLIAQIEFSENDLKSFQSFPQATHWEGQTPLCFLWCCFSWQNQIFVCLGNRTDIQNMWTHCANRIWLKIRHLAIAQKEFELSSLVNDPLRKKNHHCAFRISIAQKEFFPDSEILLHIAHFRFIAQKESILLMADFCFQFGRKINSR